MDEDWGKVERRKTKTRGIVMKRLLQKAKAGLLGAVYELFNSKLYLLV